MNDCPVYVTACVKANERWILLWDAPHKAEALRTIGRWASNPELSFSWVDCAAFSKKITAEEVAK